MPDDIFPGERSDVLAQTIDIAPTMLRFFGLEPTPDMQGHDLAPALESGTLPREAALFGIHGGHVNVTDGRHTYMRSSVDVSNRPLDNYTLMPTHMRARFGVRELAEWDPAEPFSFTKGVRTMRVPSSGGFINPWAHGTLLFDLVDDPNQERPLVDDETELRMLGHLVERMRHNDAPPGQFERLGLPVDGEPTADHLLVAAHADRAAVIAEPLPRLDELAAADLLSRPLRDLVDDGRYGPIVKEEAPDLMASELLTFAPMISLLRLAAMAQLPSEDLRRIDARLDAARAGG